MLTGVKEGGKWNQGPDKSREERRTTSTHLAKKGQRRVIETSETDCIMMCLPVCV